MDEKKSVFAELFSVNVNEHTETKKSDGTELTYLSWPFAWAEVKKRYPGSTYEIVKQENGLPYVHDENTGYMVSTRVKIDGVTHEMWLPVMDGANKAMKSAPYIYKVKNKNFRYAKKCEDGVYRDSYGREQPEFFEKTVNAATMFDVNKAIMRCLVKNLAMFGLGLYIYAGEDLPDGEKPPAPEPVQPVTPDSPDVEIAVAKGMCQTAMKAYAQRSGKGNKEVNDAVREYIGKNYKDFTVDDWRSAAQAVEGWK